MAAQRAAKVVFEDGPEVAPSAGAVEGIRQTQLACQPLSHHAIGDAAGAVLVLGPFFFENLQRFCRIAAGAVDLARTADQPLQLATGFEILPLYPLVVVFAIPQLGVAISLAFVGQIGVAARVFLFAQRHCHLDHGPQCAEIKTGAHDIRAPELDVVGVVVGFDQRALLLRVPGANAILEAAPRHRITLFQP